MYKPIKYSEMEATVEIKVGSIVRYEEGWYRVTRATKEKVNLGRVFGGKIYYKGVLKREVVEDEAAWRESWERSETYMCM